MSYKTYLSGTPIAAQHFPHTGYSAYGHYDRHHPGYGYGYPGSYPAYPSVEDMKNAREAEEARVAEFQNKHEEFCEAEKQKAEEYAAAEKKSYEEFIAARKQAVEDPAFCGPAYGNAINYGSYAHLHGYGYPGYYGAYAHGVHGYYGCGASPAQRIKTRGGHRTHWY